MRRQDGGELELKCGARVRVCVWVGGVEAACGLERVVVQRLRNRMHLHED